MISSPETVELRAKTNNGIRALFRYMSQNPKESWILYSTLWIQDSMSIKLCIRIPISLRMKPFILAPRS